ncbi:MAG: class I SAM-dependent methyltransferase [Solirubrobacterales bacterium]|nr:class I SAM-dependent methyltransferase [Solirubrobacterales bacterium]
MDPRLDDNLRWWDERVPLHVASDFYDVAGFLGGAETLRPFELEEVGNVVGRSLAHLQCHFGLDTLSWARHGARVTGLDFSEPAVTAARELAERTEIEAEFVTADVYDAVTALGGRRFEIVYTGLGALNWLPDLERWARVVIELIEPGGVLYLSEFHPLSGIFGDDELTVENDYFAAVDGVRIDEGGTYADLGASTDHNLTLEWNHGLGETVSALLSAGLQLELLHEHEHTLFPRWPFLEPSAGGYHRMPPGRPRLPLMYSLRARAPQAA